MVGGGGGKMKEGIGGEVEGMGGWEGNKEGKGVRGWGERCRAGRPGRVDRRGKGQGGG